MSRAFPWNGPACPCEARPLGCRCAWPATHFRLHQENKHPPAPALLCLPPSLTSLTHIPPVLSLWTPNTPFYCRDLGVRAVSGNVLKDHQLYTLDPGPCLPEALLPPSSAWNNGSGGASRASREKLLLQCLACSRRSAEVCSGESCIPQPLRWVPPPLGIQGLSSGLGLR